MRAVFFLLILLRVCLVPALAEVPPTTAFESANKLFEQGKYAEAVTAYNQLVQSNQVSAALYFNLGNACFKAGQMGQAIAAYRQAAQLSPRDPDVRANLRFARDQVAGPTLAPGRWVRWLGRLSLNEWACLAAAAFWAWLILLTLVQWRPQWKSPLRHAVMASSFAVILLFAGCTAAHWNWQTNRTVVVIAPEAVVRHGPLDESQSAFTVHDGAELRVLDQKDDWLQVSSDPRRIGWLRRTQVRY